MAYYRLLAVVAVASISILGVAGPSTAQQIVGYGPQGPMVLVAPDGSILSQVPEYGSVEVYRNPRGQRVLVGRDGRLVATEMPLSVAERQQRQAEHDMVLPRSGWNDSVQRLDLSPPRGQRWGGGRYSSLDTHLPSATPGLEGNDGTFGLQGQGMDNTPPAPAYRDPGVVVARQKVAALQVLLDRAGASPGVIDGRMGGNMRKALDAYATMTGHRLSPDDDTATIGRKLAETGGPAFRTYTITPADAAGPYVASIPTDYAKKAEMTSMGYTSTAEMLAERFHIDESYMKAINPGVNFSVPGTIIKVANVQQPKKGKVSLIIVDKTEGQVRGYAADGTLLVAYPATIGSTDLPSPSGTVQVTRIAPNPDYTYNPKINFKQGDNNHVLTVPPGPNGPVGNMWIALSKPTYGIHGTPEPSLIGKSSSHGCVRLTNWDADDLATMIKPGVTVEFTGHKS